ncbi:MAG: serine/threonine-protein kinase [Thermoguttaceae bacterium]
MSWVERSPFEQCVLASGLLSEKQLDEARAGVRWSHGNVSDANAPPTDLQLADRLIEMGLLNPWQAKQLFDGRTKFNLGAYWIVDSIGKGGMGQVFKAQLDKVGRAVAIKVLPRNKCTPEAIANFSREIRAMASLHHPKLVAAVDSGQDGKVHYLVTEYVDGVDLRKLIRRAGPLCMTAAANIIYQVADGLEHAHAKGIIHRDVKPGNVLVTPAGDAKLSDLGLAGPLESTAENDPRYGKIVGTADYLSPDQVKDPWTPTPAWDIYALGCTLYYIVTAKVAFPGGSTSDKARAHLELRPLDPRLLNPRLSGEFVDMLADMMAKDPSQRIPSATAVKERIKPWLPGGPLADAPTGELGENAQPIRPRSPPVALPQMQRLHGIYPNRPEPPEHAESMPLPETKIDYPELPQISESSDSSSNRIVTILDLLNEQDSSEEMQIPSANDWFSIHNPISVLITSTAGLVIFILLIWLLILIFR